MAPICLTFAFKRLSKVMKEAPPFWSFNEKQFYPFFYANMNNEVLRSFLFASVDFKEVKWHQSRRLRGVVVLIGLSLSAALVLSLYYTGMFHGAPELPDRMEGQAIFTTENGDQETSRWTIPGRSCSSLWLILFRRLMDPTIDNQFGRRILSVHETMTGNFTVNATKIVIQDYNAVRFH